uniref:Putative secreted protein n=1 Tax=Rhipicephalus microplus TaxID=6941 RepID=A0A6M2DEF4_RHIMP
MKRFQKKKKANTLCSFFFLFFFRWQLAGAQSHILIFAQTRLGKYVSNSCCDDYRCVQRSTVGSFNVCSQLL